LGLVDEVLGAIPSSASSLLGGLTRAASQALKGSNPLTEHGLAGLVASEEQLDALSRLSALMSVLEGHGEVVMDVAARDLVPDAEHFHSILRDRRTQASAPSKLVSQLLGLDAKMRQYEEGEVFVRALRMAGGPDLVAELFLGPEQLPSLNEVRNPQLWLHRAAVAVR
jgi:putative hydrolase